MVIIPTDVHVLLAVIKEHADFALLTGRCKGNQAETSRGFSWLPGGSSKGTSWPTPPEFQCSETAQTQTKSMFLSEYSAIGGVQPQDQVGAHQN